MTPRNDQMGRAYFLAPSAQPHELNVLLEPEDKIAAAAYRKLGGTADTLEGACEAPVFSEPARVRLWQGDPESERSSNRRVARALREHPNLVADSLGELYRVIVGRDLADGMRGGGHSRVKEAQLQSDFANSLAETMNRVALGTYAAPYYGEETLFRPVATKDLRAQKIVSFDAPPDPPLVDPESADYVEQPRLTETVVTYSMEQRGTILTIPRKIVINNDVGFVQRMAEQLGRAARRALARSVWTLWSGNATYGGDGLAWFHTSHANVQSTALAEAEVIAAVRKLLDQTEPGSGERLGIPIVPPGRLWLTVPTALWDTAMKLNQTTASALYHVFGDHDEQIIVNGLLTDASDWGVHRSAADVESVRVAFLDGREEPTLLLADHELAGQMFLGDKLQYKLRHEWGAAVADTHGAVKAIVP